MGGLCLCVGVCEGLCVDVDEEAGAVGLRGCGLRVLADGGCDVLATGGVKNVGAGSVSYVDENAVSVLGGLGCSGGDEIDGKNG